MKKVVTVTIVLMLLMCISAFATRNRLRTMGASSITVIDDDNIRSLPGRTFEFPNIAVAEFGSNDLTELGVHCKIGEEKPFVLAIYFNTDEVNRPRGYGEPGPAFMWLDGGALDDELGHRNIDLYYGRPLGGNNFGFHLGYYSASFEDTDPAGLGKESANSFDFGFGLTDGAGDWDIAASATFGGWTDEDADGGIETEPDGYSEIGVMGRYFWHQNPNRTFIPHAGFAVGTRGEIDNWGGDSDPATNDINTKTKFTGFHVGMGWNEVPTNNVLVVADFGFRVDKVKTERVWTTTYAATAGSDEQTDTRTVIPYWRMGFEAQVFDWMDVRMGATSDWMSEKREFASTFEVKRGFADNQTYLGFGFHWGRFHVDTWTDPEMFLEGFEFINGNGNNDMNFGISALYEMFK